MVSGKNLGPKGEGTPKVNNASSSPHKTPSQIRKTSKRQNPHTTPFSWNNFPVEDSELMIMLRDEANRPKIKDLGLASIDEFNELVHCDGNLWKLDPVFGNNIPNNFEDNKQSESPDNILEETIKWINEDNPVDQLPDFGNIPAAQPLTTECTKETAVVSMNPLDLVNLFMDVDKWSGFFFENVYYAALLEKISEGEKGPNDYNGAIQLVYGTFFLPAPLVETRNCYFLRSCRKMLDSERWLVVDVSLDSIFPGYPSPNYRKRPSGCLIEADEKSGYSKVLWIEHVEADSSVVHKLFKPHVTSGYGFGAAHWVSALTCQLARKSSDMLDCVEEIKQGKKELLRLAEIMTLRYILAITTPKFERWKPVPVPGSEDILINTTFNAVDPGCPSGVVATVATTLWLQAPPCKVSDFLRDAGNRHKWDLLSLNSPSQALVSVSTNPNSKSCVSIIPILPSMPVMFYLQEVRVRQTATYIVYAPVDMYALSSVLQGQDCYDVEICASGFVVMPDRIPVDGENVGGTLLTISLQIADDKHAMPHDHLPQKSVKSFSRIMMKTVSLIKDAIMM